MPSSLKHCPIYLVTFVRSTFAQSLQPYIKNFKYRLDEKNDWRENPKIKIHCYSEKGKGIVELWRGIKLQEFSQLELSESSPSNMPLAYNLPKQILLTSPNQTGH